MKFIPSYSLSNTLVNTLPEHEIQNEPMIFGGSWDFCRVSGGDLTNYIMDRIENEVSHDIEPHAYLGYHPVIDTKVVQLMPGMYPCIPGWHCDGVIRNDKSSQPSLDTLNEPVYHYIASIASEDTARTEIMKSRLEIDVDPKNVWGSVDQYVSEHSTFDSFGLRSGQIARFRRSTLHRGTPAVVRTWRFFFRLSFYHMPCMNQIRNQVQVYTTNGGW